MQAGLFRADYNNGDTYSQIRYPEHNYVRTLSQSRLYEEAKASVPAMKEYMQTLLG